jgi:hypothetical protein
VRVGVVVMEPGSIQVKIDEDDPREKFIKSNRSSNEEEGNSSETSPSSTPSPRVGLESNNEQPLANKDSLVEDSQMSTSAVIVVHHLEDEIPSITNSTLPIRDSVSHFIFIFQSSDNITSFNAVQDGLHLVLSAGHWDSGALQRFCFCD